MVVKREYILYIYIYINIYIYNYTETLLFYSLCYRCLCVSSFWGLPVFSVSRSISDFYAKIPDFYADIRCYLGFYMRYRAWSAVGGAGGVPGWLGGVRSLVRVFTQACSLTC